MKNFYIQEFFVFKKFLYSAREREFFIFRGKYLYLKIFCIRRAGGDLIFRPPLGSQNKNKIINSQYVNFYKYLLNKYIKQHSVP